MFKYFFIFLKKAYKTLIVIFVLIGFFSIYNIYVVDHSLINLKIALNRLAQAQTPEDIEKIKPLLKIPLFTEIAKVTPSAQDILAIESVDNIASDAKDMRQLEDARFFLKSVISSKEQKRGKVLSFLDNINTYILGPKVDIIKASLDKKIRDFLTKASTERDQGRLQELYYNIGNMYLQLSELDKAAEFFNKAIEISGESQLAQKSRYNLAWTYKYGGDYEKAISLLDKQPAGASQIQLNVSSGFQAADLLYKNGKYQEARDRYVQLASQNPDLESSALALFKAGTISLYQLNDFKASLKFFYDYALLKASDISFHELNELDAAIKYLSKIEESLLKAGKSSDKMLKDVRNLVLNRQNLMSKDFRDEGYRLLSKKEYLESIASFNKAIEINSSDGKSYVGRGLALYWLGRKEEAKEEARKAVEVSLEDEFAMVNSLFILINCGNTDEAIIIGERIIGQRRRVIRDPQLYYNIGYAHVLSAKMPEATLYFDRALRLNNEFAFAFNNLGCTFWSLKNYAEAIKKFQQAIDRYPAYADAYFNLGIAYFELNRLPEAYSQFERVLDIDPDYKEAFLFLNRISKILGYRP